MDMLKKAGCHFVSPIEFLQFLRHGGGLPPKPVLVTFDDGYQDLEDVVLPILKERGIPAVVFAVSGRLGGTNEWDHAIGAPQIRLLDADGLKELGAAGVMIGAHSRSHRPLTEVSGAGLSDEINGSLAELESAGLPCPTMFAYPYGEYDERVKDQTKSAGVEAAFTVVAGVVRPDQDPFEVPRIEILRRDTGWKFLWKVWRAGRWTRKQNIPTQPSSQSPDRDHEN
jgi:peptidoglycan/xylan/chitin deacetylase (PgdA/CDA1 family)